MEVGLLALRVIVGGLFVGHGAQKLFGRFRGAGLDGTGEFFESVGLRPGRMMAMTAGLAELTGGTLFALGLLTPLAAALLIAVMCSAIATVALAQRPLGHRERLRVPPRPRGCRLRRDGHRRRRLVAG